MANRIPKSIPDDSEDQRQILANQTELYKHYQQQASSLIRIFIASIAIIATFTSIDLITFIQSLSIPTKKIKIQQAGITYDTLYHSFALGNLAVAVTLALVALLLLGNSLVAAGRSLRVDPLEPSIYSEESQPHREAWIAKNSHTISELDHHLQSAYRRIIEGSLVAVLSAMLLVAIFLKTGHILAGINLFIVFAPIITVSEFGFRIVIPAVKSDEPFWRSLKESSIEKLQERLHVWPDLLTITLSLSIFLFSYIISLILVIIWYNAVWSVLLDTYLF